MSLLSKTSALTLVIAAGLLGGCSDIYYDRRESISPGAGDAIEANKVTHMVDPWPSNVGNRDIAFNGQRMQAAHERYRNNKVITPVNVTTSSVAYQKAQQESAASGMSGPAAPAAPVRGP